MKKFVLSPAAKADLANIWEYTEKCGNADQAEEYIRELQRGVERAAANPRIAKACDEIRKGHFKLAVGSHVLFYRATADETIDVVRILHQRMDVDRHL